MKRPAEEQLTPEQEHQAQRRSAVATEGVAAAARAFAADAAASVAEGRLAPRDAPVAVTLLARVAAAADVKAALAAALSLLSLLKAQTGEGAADLASIAAHGGAIEAAARLVVHGGSAEVELGTMLMIKVAGLVPAYARRAAAARFMAVDGATDALIRALRLQPAAAGGGGAGGTGSGGGSSDGDDDRKALEFTISLLALLLRDDDSHAVRERLLGDSAALEAICKAAGAAAPPGLPSAAYVGAMCLLALACGALTPRFVASPALFAAALCGLSSAAPAAAALHGGKLAYSYCEIILAVATHVINEAPSLAAHAAAAPGALAGAARCMRFFGGSPRAEEASSAQKAEVLLELIALAEGGAHAHAAAAAVAEALALPSGGGGADRAEQLRGMLRQPPFGLSQLAVDALETAAKAAAAERVALQRQVAELEAVPVNTRAAIVELAGAVRQQ